MTVTQTETQSADELYRTRIQSAITGLARYGVNEEMIRAVARLSPEEWQRFTHSAEGISSRQLVHLSGALLLETIYLFTGDERNRIRYSPCTFTALIKAEYPESEIPR